MLSIQTSFTFPLSSVKPLEELSGYRTFCLDATTRVLAGDAARRERSPIDGTPLETIGEVGGLEYCRCASSGSLFLREVAEAQRWAALLAEVSRHRHSPDAFHSDLTNVRLQNVYVPKLEWMQSTLRLQGLASPRLLEVATPPSEFSALLGTGHTFAEVVTISESELTAARDDGPDTAQAAVVLESFDRAADPVALMQAIATRLVSGGLIFVTAQVASGFDIEVLGLRDQYLYPPDRTNCLSLGALEQLLRRAGFTIVELSTPGVLDVEIVLAHARHDPTIPVSRFERRLLAADAETRRQFQVFLQQARMSSFARVVGRKE